MAKKNLFGARLVQKMMEDIEPYLACCQLGITMASLGLGWVGEPTVAALLEPALAPLGMPENAVHVAHRARRAGAENAGHPRAHPRLAMGRLSALCVLHPVLSA